jgi:anthranilate synthase component 1
MLLESNDYHSRTDSRSYIGCNPLVELIADENGITVSTPGGSQFHAASTPQHVPELLAELVSAFQFSEPVHSGNGFFSLFAFEYAHLQETTTEILKSSDGFPKAHLILYEYLILLDHFHDNGSLLINSLTPETPSSATDFHRLLHIRPEPELPFELLGEETSTSTETSFRDQVIQAKKHINRGDVFQLVLSRAFRQSFFGDDFQVYRALRRLNPSPYLFYADFESFRLMGSSPETQIRLTQGQAVIHPIAGTVRKTGNPDTDKLLTEQLVQDEKENAEHTMLVDLARNDLSKYCTEVKVGTYKEVQHFSHVIHLVSKVTGKLADQDALALFGGTFPAGTLSGTPKPMALQLIRKLEGDTRDYYGGAIGFIHANGDMNLAIIIRSIYSRDNVLHYRAGAGIVLDSVSENETEEVRTKLQAVRRAIHSAHASSHIQL